MNQLQSNIEKFLLENPIPKPAEFIAGQTYIPASAKKVDEADFATLMESVMDGWFTEGRWAKAFSKELSEVTSQRFISLCNSGSSANLLALSALMESNKSMKILTCASGFPTTVNAVLQNGGTLLVVDADKHTLNAVMWQLMNEISRADVGGVILAHTLGFPFNEEIVAKKCREMGKWLISDCCDALGATVGGNPVGYYSDASTYSFYPAHHITCGEGGAVAVSNPKLDQKIKSYRDWGRDCWCDTGVDGTCGRRFSQQFGELPEGFDHKYVYSRLGYNLKLTDMQAALGYSQIQKLESFTQQRLINYEKLLLGLNHLFPNVSFIRRPHNAIPSPFGFPLVLARRVSRQDFVNYLNARKIGTRQVFSGNILRQPAYLPYKNQIEHVWPLSGSDYIMEQVIWVACHPSLTDAMINYMIEIISDYFRRTE